MKVGKRAKPAPDGPGQTEESGILEAALDAIITADDEGRILSFNRAAEQIFGYARDEVIGRSLAETIVPPRDRARHEAGFRRYVKTREAEIIGRRIELTARRADGSEFPVELSLTSEDRGPPPAKVRLTAFIRDITEAKRAERLLKESEARFRAMIENASDLITLVKADATILFQAPSIEMLGYTPSEMVGRSALELIHPEDIDIVVAALTAVAAEPGAVATAEYRFRHKDGSWRVLNSVGRNATDVVGVEGIVVNSRDVTQQKESEAAQARLVAILDATPDFVGIATPEREVIYVNRSGRRMIGLGENEDLSGIKTPSFHTDAMGCFLKDVALPAAIKDGIWAGESILVSRDGREIPVSQVIIAHRDAAGRVAYFSTVCRDMTEHRRASEAQERLLNAFDRSPEGYALFDRNDRLIFANRAYLDLMEETRGFYQPGAKYEDMLRAAIAVGVVPEAAGREEEWIRTRLERRGAEPTPFEVQRGKEHRWHRVLEQRLPDGSIFMVRTDITAEKLREAQLVQAQKMEVVGQLTGGVAHDFNNLLAVIQGNLELLAEYAHEDEKIARFVAPALRAAQRGGELTQRLLAFSRRQMLRPEIIDLNTLVTDIIELLRRTLGATIEIATDLTDAPCLALVDANQLENALLNLAVNARDAMPEGGRLTMATRMVELGIGDFDAGDEVAPGIYAAVVVADTGRGMTPDVLSRVYEPFFTTKNSGSGLGLSMVYGFMKQTGGHITIASEVDGGTTVTLYLPSTAADVDVEAIDTDRHATPEGNGESILVVEDDAEVRELVARQLAGLGYRVQQADSAATALEMLSRAEDVDLLLTDIVLPGSMSGVGLIKAVRARYAGLRILCMSGFAQRAFAGEDLAALDATLLNKPFRLSDLARAVRATLDQD